MAKNIKIIKKRIASVTNTRKITKTMEMIATAKSKKAQDRTLANQPYTRKIKSIINNLTQGTGNIQNPLLQKRLNPQNVLFLTVVSNRGLCGAYNTNVLKLAESKYLELVDSERNVQMEVVGKKGITFYKFNEIPAEKSPTDIKDNFTFEQFEEIPERILEMFTSGKIDEFYLAYTKYESSSRQRAVVARLLPFQIEASSEKETSKDAENKKNIANYIFEPNAKEILNSILPYAFKMNLFQNFLESFTSEHLARRIAMKSATDAATDMIKDLSLTYNRARQSKITQEISEIIGGASALAG